MKKNYRIMIAVVAVLTMLAMFAGCGSSTPASASAETPDAPEVAEAVESTNGLISVEPPAGTGLVTFVSDYNEQIQFNVADEATPAQRTDTTKFIEISTTKSNSPSCFSLYLKSYVKDTPYTAEAMKADLEAEHEAYPNILEEEADVTIGDVTYFRWSVTTNGAPAYYYFATVNDVPVVVQVVGADLVDSDAVQTMMESIKWNV